MTQHSSIPEADKVADAIKHSWVYYLPKWLWPYAQLARWERPIGWQLLMWPCWWSVMLAVMSAQAGYGAPISPQSGSFSDLSVILFNLQKIAPLFLTVLLPLFAGAFLMRGAGCTYNDLADIDIDNQVERTRSRPLPSGRVTKVQAIVFLVLQSLGGLCVLLYLSRFDSFVFWLGAASLILVTVYPFMKRITWWPQLFLGLAFSWGALFGWGIIWREITVAPILLYLGSIFWVIGYDTIYAHQDREDDALVGVKSTARLFGTKTRQAISLLYLAAVTLFVTVYWLTIPLTTEVWVWPAWLGLLIGSVQMFWQIRKLDIDDGEKCLRLFKSNNTFGLILFAGQFGSLLVL
ncbi:MAG: 4-hydroxybenzoate octaprenyltransferase [Rhizobiaceae bacterium]